MEKVSVIVPTYNEERYIKFCILALKNQDYNGEYEIIVSDGGSKDNTVKIARKLADKVIICKKKRSFCRKECWCKSCKR
jgi:glycosyltransferase involved in cell wall biosynthesis